jgi:hypothetical protein
VPWEVVLLSPPPQAEQRSRIPAIEKIGISRRKQNFRTAYPQR